MYNVSEKPDCSNIRGSSSKISRRPPTGSTLADSSQRLYIPIVVIWFLVIWLVVRDILADHHGQHYQRFSLKCAYGRHILEAILTTSNIRHSSNSLMTGATSSASWLRYSRSSVQRLSKTTNSLRHVDLAPARAC